MESCKSRREPNSRLWITALALVAATASGSRAADDVAALRLVPFPKEIRFEAGEFDLRTIRAFEATADRLPLLGNLLADALGRAGLKRPPDRPDAAAGYVLRAIGDGPAVPLYPLRDPGSDEDYTLRVAPGGVTIAGRGPAGLIHGVQTLVQLVRANRHGHGLPCLVIRDWPSLRWRCFQNDMTRGPSATLETLRQQVALGSLLKMNLFTYYMESQYHWAKHPEIGPSEGSLQPDELRRLVEYARPLGLEILGTQQSFGHLFEILKHPQFAGLRETPEVITPVKEETYRLLDDLYAEVCPLLPLGFFNVCCDETWGLGSGPSKELAAKIGVGGVYVGHMRRVHDLLAAKYKKRMMMWGDIILKHPGDLDKIPKDTVMLTWEYGAAASFERQILPFARSGYEFFVCPGTSDWNRVLPDFGYAEINIRNFVRDGAKHGALGMLNTTWKDDGESLNAPNWHGYAWGAECAWNASATEPADFNRRIGAVLFGENDNHFGRAIDLLAQTHRLFGTFGLMNRRFWENDFLARRDPALAGRKAEHALALVGPAIYQLRACRQQAVVNGDLLDALLFGAERMKTIAHRSLDAVEVAGLYQAAYDGRPEEAAAALARAEGLVRRNRDALETLGRRFAALWLTENKPYFLDRTVKRYAAFAAALDQLAERLAAARRNALAGHAIPAPEDFGVVVGALSRRTRPQTIANRPLDAAAAWEESTATHRLAMVVAAGAVARSELPIELDVRLPTELSRRPVRAFCNIGPGPAEEILAQIDPSPAVAKTRLTLLLPGPLARGSQAKVRVYLGLARQPRALPGAVSTRDAEHGMKWIENDRVRLLLGPEGGHVYRWEVKALGGRDLTMPGQTGWHGFADVSDGHRSTPHVLRSTAAGPALVRYCCTDDRGLAKTVSLFGSVAWMEVVVSEPVTRYWDYDNPLNFCADGPTPGRYLFSNGAAGVVGRRADGVPAQVKADGVAWGVKFNAQGVTLGMVAPDGPVRFVIAPGAGAGGVGIENSPPAAHFATYGGVVSGEPKAVMEGLRSTLDFRMPPAITLGTLQARAEAPR
jgi:hypothetical protein